MEMEEVDPDAFRILISSDNHLGYGYTNPEIADDSFIVFEEVLQHAKEQNVDFILLGGDLFHENKPSHAVVHRCMQLLRKYCLGFAEQSFEFNSNPADALAHETLNYEDKNYHVSLPIFSIHGNHDDPLGKDQTCVLDILTSAGLVNFFGKQRSVNDVNIAPLLMQKGENKLALYGLGAMKDERLHKLWKREKVNFGFPDDVADWFNIFVIHQNRRAHGPANYIPEYFLPSEMDFVLWGHEHDCHTEAEFNVKKEFYVYQPGSSIYTSLAEGESYPKHCGLIEVSGTNFSLNPIELKRRRQFYFDYVALKDSNIDPKHRNVDRMIETHLQEKVSSILAKAAAERMPMQPAKPLIRLRVDTSDGEYPTILTTRFGHQFAETVANYDSILLFQRTMNRSKDGDLSTSAVIPEVLIAGADVENINVSDVVNEYLKKNEKNWNLVVLPLSEVNDALDHYIGKGSNDAFTLLSDEQMDRKEKELIEKIRSVDSDEIKAELKLLLSLKGKEDDEDEMLVGEDVENRPKGVSTQLLDDDSDDCSITAELAIPTKRGRGATTARGGRGIGKRGNNPGTALKRKL